jgi:hypothetical protein
MCCSIVAPSFGVTTNHFCSARCRLYTVPQHTQKFRRVATYDASAFCNRQAPATAPGMILHLSGLQHAACGAPEPALSIEDSLCRRASQLIMRSNEQSQRSSLANPIVEIVHVTPCAVFLLLPFWPIIMEPAIEFVHHVYKTGRYSCLFFQLSQCC